MQSILSGDDAKTIELLIQSRESEPEAKSAEKTCLLRPAHVLKLKLEWNPRLRIYENGGRRE